MNVSALDLGITMARLSRRRQYVLEFTTDLEAPTFSERKYKAQGFLFGGNWAKSTSKHLLLCFFFCWKLTSPDYHYCSKSNFGTIRSLTRSYVFETSVFVNLRAHRYGPNKRARFVT
jgi:hypothetical protein